jgi:hypothetical protein
VELRQHDALLRAVTKSAAELLGSHSLETPVNSVLELIGETLSVCRVHLAEIIAGDDGHFRSSLRNEWCALGVSPLLDDPGFRNIDLTVCFPKLMDRLLAGERSPYHVNELAPPHRARCERAGMRSILHIPIHVESALWGSLNFIDSTRTVRHWSWGGDRYSEHACRSDRQRDPKRPIRQRAGRREHDRSEQSHDPVSAAGREGLPLDVHLGQRWQVRSRSDDVNAVGGLDATSRRSA